MNYIYLLYRKLNVYMSRLKSGIQSLVKYWMLGFSLEKAPRLVGAILLIYVICGSGCGTVSKSSRIDYINKHPELTSEQKDLLLKGELWVGMTPQDAKASIGNPTFTQKDILGEKEVWSYVYRDQYTTHRDYKFDRVLRLEFLEGRLANWRED